METAERSVDAMMERDGISGKGRSSVSQPAGEQAAARRHVRIRRLLILTQAQMEDEATVADAIHVMDDPAACGHQDFYAFREALVHSPTFQRLEEDFRKYGAAEDMNSAMFDREVLIFSQTYGTVPLGMVGTPTPITMINRLQISWKPEMIRELDPARYST